MAVITVADALRRAEEFERAVASLYSNLATQAEQDGVRLLTGYMSRRRPRVPERLALLGRDRLAAISSTPLAYEPYGADCHCLDGMSPPVAGSAAEVLDMALNFNECLARFYRQVIQQVADPAVVELFESLICLEQQDEIELKKIKALDYF